MNIVLWVLQVALAWLCIAGGIFQIFKIEDLKKSTKAMRELPRGLWAFLGAFGVIAGLGLIIPPLINVPIVTPIAAVAVAAESLLISGFYVRYGDRSPLIFSGAMTVLAAIVAYGRFELLPFQ